MKELKLGDDPISSFEEFGLTLEDLIIHINQAVKREVKEQLKDKLLSPDYVKTIRQLIDADILKSEPMKFTNDKDNADVIGDPLKSSRTVLQKDGLYHMHEGEIDVRGIFCKPEDE